MFSIMVAKYRREVSAVHLDRELRPRSKPVRGPRSEVRFSAYC